MHCHPGANPPSGLQSSARIRLDLDLRRRAITNLKEFKADRIAFSLAKAIEDEISDAQWAELRNMYFAEKQRQTEQADLDQIEIQFPPGVLQGEGSIVGYYELFPYARQIVATIDDVPWILDDQYCVNPTAAAATWVFHSSKAILLPFRTIAPKRLRLRFDTLTTR